MKNTILLTAMTVALTAGAGIAYKAYADCGMDHSSHAEMDHSEAKTDDHSGHDMAGDSKVIMGKGVIHSVSKMNKEVNLTHEPIPALGWPEMTMDLAVAEDVDLKSIAPDQEVMFHMALGEDKVYRITEFMKPDAKMDHSKMNHGDMKHDNGDGHHGDKSHH